MIGRLQLEKQELQVRKKSRLDSTKSILEEEPHWPKVVKPGPENPLGSRAIYLSMPGYLLHGTNKPWG